MRVREKSEKRGRDQRRKGEIVREGESLREIERPREREIQRLIERENRERDTAGEEGPKPDFQWVNGGSTVGRRRMRFPVRLEEIFGDSSLDFRWIFTENPLGNFL